MTTQPQHPGGTTEDQRWFSLYQHCSHTAVLTLALAIVKVQQHWLSPDQVVQPAKKTGYTFRPARRSGDVALWPTQRAGLWETLGAKPLCLAATELKMSSPCMLTLLWLQSSGRT